MNVNNLTYDSETFLNVLSDIDEDTAVHYFDLHSDRMWEGTMSKDTMIIKCLNDAEQAMRILAIYFPVLDKYPVPNSEEVK